MMKNVTLFFTFLLLITTDLFSQDELHDVIEQYDVFVNQAPLVSRKAVVIKKFGKPVRIERVNGVEDVYWFDYHYKRSTLQIDPAGDFMGFNIVDSFFTLTFKTTKLRVGSSASILKTLFPKSYKQYTITKPRYFRVRIADNDSYILFTIKNGVITEIRTWDDYT